MRRCAWPHERALAPGESIRWPMWIHPRDRGPFGFHLAFYCEPVTPVEGMNHRSEIPQQQFEEPCLLCLKPAV